MKSFKRCLIITNVIDLVDYLVHVSVIIPESVPKKLSVELTITVVENSSVCYRALELLRD